MYKIYWCNLGKATGVSEIGTRPVVVLKRNGNTATVVSITSRNKDGKYYVRMNPFLVAGYCNCTKEFLINRKYLMGYKRDCTSSEEDAITDKIGLMKNIGIFHTMKGKDIK